MKYKIIKYSVSEIYEASDRCYVAFGAGNPHALEIEGDHFSFKTEGETHQGVIGYRKELFDGTVRIEGRNEKENRRYLILVRKPRMS